MCFDERIPNLVSELKLDDICPCFWPKIVEKWQNTLFCHFDLFFGGGECIKCYPISIFRPDLESSHQGASFRHQNELIVNTLFLAPHCNLKNLVARGRVGMKIKKKMKHVNVFPQIQQVQSVTSMMVGMVCD